MHYPNFDSFTNLGSYFYLALPSFLMRCADWWAFESLIIMSGYVGVASNAAFVVIANLSAQLFMVPMAFSSTSVILIGSSLGSANVNQAKRWFRMI